MIDIIYDDNKVDQIDESMIPPDSLLDILYRNRRDKDKNELNTTDPNIIKVIDYLKGEYDVASDEDRLIFDYWGVYRDYDAILRGEIFMRNNMYNPEFEDHEMNTDMYYRLIKADRFLQTYENFNEYDKQGRRYDDELLFFGYTVKKEFDYDGTVQSLEVFGDVFSAAEEAGVRVLIAGNYVYEALIKQGKIDVDEVDVFVVADDPVGFGSFVQIMADKIVSVVGSGFHCSRTRYCITFSPLSRTYIRINNISIKINVILKAFSTYSEILHGFDIDCTCIGYDGQEIYMTERCQYALLRGYNTVNLNLAYEFYAQRLAKYTLHGLNVKVPNLPNYSVEDVDIENVTEEDKITLENTDELSSIIPLYQMTVHSLKRQPDKVGYSRSYVNFFASSDYKIELVFQDYAKFRMQGSRMIIEDRTHAGGSGAVQFIIRARNSVNEFPIKMIESYESDVLNVLSFTDQIYKILKSIEGVQITRVPEIQLPGPIVSDILEPIQYSEEEWYIGPLVTRR